ncbi:hypothetical protein Halhy_1668 [Haliscomenobacter hydrossis DSM 1100]|uniref:Uncharacterized protein n=1 Tax=Haliscomenobacter hydrossis (strain ATCC 27775 / DSM 1100 / LMG 10767 / O) TaxID=760192 RepID=F4L1P8_HALH1|nr:hypothetical protein Halhy_1668 [Haliscomenobacter hydrossis DSM 1100]
MIKSFFDLSKKSVFLILILLGVNLTGKSQALWSTKRQVNDLYVFQDIFQKNKYYYSPSKLQLSLDAEGKPKFQLISMRYTGTQLTGDRAEKRFTNLLQFSLALTPISNEDLQNIRTQLGLTARAQLLPIAIQNMDIMIISGVTEGLSEAKWRKRASTQTETASDNGVFWNERSFVLPLGNNEAQLLWDQYENGRVALSVNYAFYAPVVQVTDEQISVVGDSVLVKKLTNKLGQIERDTLESNELIKADAINIMVDVVKYPDALKQIDINENSVPPAYPSVEVKCYDFALATRPDLAFKRVYIQGTSVNGQQVEEKIKFSSGERDITTQFVAFRYAVRMDLPIRYKIIEHTFDGSSHESVWVMMPQLSNLIDASTLQKKNPLKQRCIDVELLPEVLAAKNIVELKVHFTYKLYQKTQVQTLSFSADEALKSICLTHEKELPLQYYLTRKYADGHQDKSLLRSVSTDDYLLLKP